MNESGWIKKGDSDGLKRHSKVLYVLLLPILLYLLVQAILSGFAYVNQYRLNAASDQWYEDQEVPTLSEWTAMEELSLTSLERSENNADLLNAAGRLYDYRSANMVSSWNEKLAYGHKAIEYYRRVIHLRPAWPYGWMNLASSKGRLGEVDQEFKKALLQLLNLGPWEKNTLSAIFQLSLFAWPYLDVASRQPLLNYFVIAQENRRGDVHRVVKEIGQMKLYCALLTHKGAKASFCP